MAKNRKDDGAVYSEIIMKVLTNVPVFRNISSDSMVQLANLAKLKQYNPETTVFREGDPGDCLYIIASGKVDIIASGPGGEAIELKTLGPGDVFGEMALLDGLPRSATIRVGCAKALLFYINRTDFNLFLLKNPEVSIKLVETISRRLRDANLKIKALADENLNLKAVLQGLTS